MKDGYTICVVIALISILIMMVVFFDTWLLLMVWGGMAPLLYLIVTGIRDKTL